MNEPFFSIITATYNAENTLPRLLESLERQTCKDFELVIQDGNSSDNTLSVVEDWKDRLPSVSVISAKDSGIYDAWNRAIKRIAGKWVLFLGADDRLADSQVLAAARDVLRAVPESIIFAAGAARMLLPDGALLEEIFPSTSDAPQKLRNDMPACHAAVFHRASLFNPSFFNPAYKILGDYDLFCRTWKQKQQGLDLPFFVTEMAIGGISSSLDKQPLVFRESVRIQWKNFGWIPLGRSKIFIKCLAVAGLCKVFGKSKASYFIDKTRKIRNKPPKWSLFPPENNRKTPLIEAKHVTAVIVNYNGGDDTVSCLQSIQAMHHKPGRVIVVDNASKDGSERFIFDELKSFFPSAQMVDSSEKSENRLAQAMLLSLTANNGYAAGNNAGIRLALQDPECLAVWILNNDTEPSDNSLEALSDVLNARPKVGIVGSTMVYAHAKNTVQCAGGFALSGLTGTAEALHGGNKLGDTQNLPQKSIEAELSYICGASMLVRRSTIDSVGLLPEEYFLYYEDAAFCLCARKAGFQLAWAPKSIIFHKEGGSTGAISGGAERVLERSRFIDYLTLRNRMYFIRCFFPFFLPITITSYGGVMINRLRRGQKDRLPLVLKALADGVRKKMGKPDKSMWL